jgi:NAD+ diphosphatase
MTRIALGDQPYDRIAVHRKDDAWLAAAWAATSTRVLVIAGTRLRAPDGKLEWVTPPEAPEGTRVLLGEADGVVSFAVITGAEHADESWVGLRAVVPSVDLSDAAYAVHAIGIAEWHWAVRHCPRCGGSLEPHQAGHVLKCANCRREQFPRTDPAVIMLVVDADNRALLGRQKAWPEGRWSTLAGFVEPGESIENAVRREVAEEVGVRIGEVEYFGSQPWPMPASLMLGFIAHADSLEITVDGDEIEDARWFSHDEAIKGAEDGSLIMPGGISISRSLIDHWYGENLPGSW